MDIHQLHRVGYARVSSVRQNLDSQIRRLESGRVREDPHRQDDRLPYGSAKLGSAHGVLRPGDVLVVAELSRMTRSLMHLLETAQALDRRQVNLVSLRKDIDTNTATGHRFLSMMGAIHQMERELRAERAAAGSGLCKSAREDRRAATHRYRQVARCQSAL